MLEIKKPIWKNGDHHIGIADFRLGAEGKAQVKITYKLSDGTPRFPGYYEMPVSDIKKYPTQIAKGNVKLYIIPLIDFEHKGV